VNIGHLSDTARVLVIDDEPALTHTLTQVLSSQGLTVDVAYDGNEGLDRASAQRPHLVIVDVHMPVMDGFAFIDAFRSLPDCASTPIILATGGPDLRTARERVGSMADVQLMAKPFDLDALLRTVSRAIEKAS
jgi:two-component system response regulator MprA